MPVFVILFTFITNYIYICYYFYLCGLLNLTERIIFGYLLFLKYKSKSYFLKS